MATHTLIYLGNFDRNFSPVGTWPETYLTVDGDEKPVDEPAEKVDGIRFGYMQKDGDWFYLVNVEGLRLRAPVLLVPARHSDGKQVGPSASQFQDDGAMCLLADAMVANPEYRDQLAHVILRLR